MAAAWLAPLDGVAHGGNLRLLGRLHPLLVHFPIVLLLLVPVLEWLGHKRPSMTEAAGFVIGLAVPCSVIAVLAGVILAWADGHDGALLQAHLRGGAAVAIGATLTWLVRGHSRTAYALLLLTTLGTLAWAAHNGGSLTHGADYLTGPLPPAVKKILRIPETPAPETYPPNTLYGAAVRPVLEKHCFACHAADKQKGDYTMDTFAALLAGGKSGKTAIAPGDIMHSELLTRLALDPSDEKVMPPRKKARPSTAEIALLRWWIKQGAERAMPLTAATKAPPEVNAFLTSNATAGASSAEPVYIQKVGEYGNLREELARLEKSLGITLIPVSRRAGDGLILRARGAASRFGDAELAQLARVAPFIVEAELAGTQITDAGVAALKPFLNLERLHLERTSLTGATFNELQALPKLSYLNVCVTNINDAGLAQLKYVTSLKFLYLFDSKATHAGVTALGISLPNCFIGPLTSKTDSL